jgi:hypothetical protein
MKFLTRDFSRGSILPSLEFRFQEFDISWVGEGFLSDCFYFGSSD